MAENSPYGQITNHVLVSIANSSLVSTPRRLQRLMLRLQHYDVEIRYEPGKEMFVADHQQSDVEKEVKSIHTVNHIPSPRNDLRGYTRRP